MQIIMEYGINKGIGKSVEFRGLKAQYLFIFAGGLLAVFVVFVILYMAGVDQWVCIAFGVAAASVLDEGHNVIYKLVRDGKYTAAASRMRRHLQTDMAYALTHVVKYKRVDGDVDS